MSETDVMFSLPGSDLMNAVFLPPATAIISPWRRANIKEFEHMTLGDRRSKPDAAGWFWFSGPDLRLWFRWMPGHLLVSYNPAEDGSTTVNASAPGMIILGVEHAARLVQTALRQLVAMGQISAGEQ
jgi:hypothetical protein